MANNPVQIVMNTQNYVGYLERQPGGSNTDFYAGQDEKFAEHKASLLSQISDIKSTSAKKDDAGLVFVKVSLQSRAIAKSHRPIQKVFDIRKSDYIGGEKMGSMIMEMPAEELDKVYGIVSGAEEETTWEVRNNKRTAKPSRVRSEVGAINSIQKYSSADRRKFTIEKAREWLQRPETGGAYYIEMMIGMADSLSKPDGIIKELELSELQNFSERLEGAGFPIELSEVEQEFAGSKILVVKILREYVSDLSVHEGLISFFENEELVKHILLPPILQSEFAGAESEESVEIQQPGEGLYPVVGIIDTGVSELDGLSSWKIGETDYVPSEDQDHSHGTFIAGLIAHGDQLNQYQELDELKCKYFDLGLHPTQASKYEDYYPRGFIDFLVQLDYEIVAAKNEGVRVFNMSLSVELPVSDDEYGVFASTIDKLARKHDVIFVLPAGNLNGNLVRENWPVEKIKLLEMLAGYKYQGQDRLFQPADSISSVVVGALDPPDEAGLIKPARYTRRGPGPGLGAKPDLSHIGGKYDKNTGLKSISKNGVLVEDCGTSYAAPLVAKTLAVLNSNIEGDVGVETLKALLMHNTVIPECFLDDDLHAIRKDFVGVGIPQKADDCLTVEDYQISLIFNGTITDKNALDFQFSWPESLVNDSGGCRGDVKVTMAYAPPVDKRYGAEFVRVNMDVFLRQEEVDKGTGEVKFRGRLSGDEHKNYEKELVENGSKWWPVKVKTGRFLRKGASSQWKLVVVPLVRANCLFPEEGIPFSVVLTISDGKKIAPVFTEMRTQLQQQGVEMSDVKTALTARVR